MFRKFLRITGSWLLVVIIAATLAFTSGKSNDVLCSDIEIFFENDDLIKLDRNELIEIVKRTGDAVIGEKLNRVNLDAIENAIEKNPAILNAEVYKVLTPDSNMLKGILSVKVKHRKPVVRVLSETAGTGYYLDKTGVKIPAASNYAANVLVATGNYSVKFAKEKLLPFVNYIENDEFWRAQIQQIHIKRNGELLLTPLVGNHIIEFGKIEGYQKKLQKMKAFYQQVLAKNNWNKYKTISLKYNNQVVAKRR